MDTEARVQHVLARMREHGGRMTPQRAAVVRVLVESTAHPSAEQVYEELLPQYPMLSLATVYKTVALLKEMGELIELMVDGVQVHFDGRQPYAHPHLVCKRCGSIIDVPIDQPHALAEQVAQTTGYAEVSASLDFWGVCPRCQSRE